jgi:hypothetical protein
LKRISSKINSFSSKFDMSFKKYRLAAPSDNDNINVSNRSTLPNVSFRVPLLSTSNNDKLNNPPKVSNPRWWLVLPSLVLVFLSSSSDGLLMNDLIVRRFERYYGLSASEDAESAACRQLTTTTPAPIMRMFYWQLPPSGRNPPDYDLVQRETASFNVKNALATLIPSVVTFIIFGSNSDIIGRRPLLVLPFIGKIVRYILMIIIVARDLSNTWLIVTGAIEAIFGSSGLSLLSAFSYITDCTDKTRTHAFFLTEVLLVIARIIPVLAIGLWLRHHLYIGPLSVDLGLSIIGLFYALFIQPESVESV